MKWNSFYAANDARPTYRSLCEGLADGAGGPANHPPAPRPAPDAGLEDWEPVIVPPQDNHHGGV